MPEVEHRTEIAAPSISPAPEAAAPVSFPLDHRASLEAGLCGGLAFLAITLLMTPLSGLGSWDVPFRFAAAIVMGTDVLSMPRFNGAVLTAALLAHFGLSVPFGRMICALTDGMYASRAVLSGMLFALIVYLVNFYVATIVCPWFVDARGGIAVLAHLAYGGIVAASYRGLRHSAEN